jgi:hypothetical protein
LCTGGARPHRITHPYPNLPVHGREGTGVRFQVVALSTPEQ